MSLRISNIGLWVHDQDEALAWYTEKLGFELREDVTLAEFGDYRWLTVSPPGQPDIRVILNVPGPPLFDEETTAQVLSLVSKGAMGGVMLATDDCKATYEELSGRGVEFSLPPTEQPYGVDAQLRDISGNEMRLVQRTDGNS